MSEFAEQQMPNFATFDQRASEAPEGALNEILWRLTYPENQHNSEEGQSIMMFWVWPYVLTLEHGQMSPESNAAAYGGLYFAEVAANYLLGDRVMLPNPHDAAVDLDERRTQLLAARDDYLHANPYMAGWIQRVTTAYKYPPWRKLVFETVATSMLQMIEDVERQKFIDLESEFRDPGSSPETTD